MTALLPCPFCGEPSFCQANDMIHCYTCKVYAQWPGGFLDQISAWNTRAPSPRSAEESLRRSKAASDKLQASIQKHVVAPLIDLTIEKIEQSQAGSLDEGIMTELLPCPFCGGEADGPEDYYSGPTGLRDMEIHCRDCSARVAEFWGEPWNGDKEAIAAWNTREGSPLPPNVVIEIRKRGGVWVHQAIRLLESMTDPGNTKSVICEGNEDHVWVREKAAPQPTWIPVTERLPEDSGVYLTYDETGDLISQRYSAKTKEWEFSCYPATHWQPLPEPPGETE